MPGHLSKTNSHYRYPTFLCALVLFMIVVVEINHPFYFLQDDNRVQYLPFYVHNLRALLGGEFPFYNFHQYLGTPVTIQYAALYPVNYIALYLSKLVFGNYFGAMEFIAVFHLIVAALGFFRLMRFFELDEVSCLFGALAWTFCGSVITVGNSWIATLGYAALYPWILFFAIQLIYRFELINFIILIMLKACAMLLGNPQLFVYVMTFEFLTVVLLYFTNRKHSPDPVENNDSEFAAFPPPTLIKLLTSLLASYFFVFIVTLPLILQTLQQTTISAGRSQLLSWEQYAANSYNIHYWLNGLSAPFRAAGITTQFELHFISHIGYMTLVFALISVINIKKRAGGKQVAVFCILAVLSLMWASDFVITKILYYVPVYNRFRFPFRLVFFTSFYLVTMSAFGFDIFYRKLKIGKYIKPAILRLILALILILHMSNFLIFHALLPQNMFSRHFDAVPFDEPLREKLTAGRIVSAGLDDVWDGQKIIPGFSAPLLGFDYATLWGLFHFGGYDTMVSEKTRAATLGIKDNSVYNLPVSEPFQIPSDTLEYFRQWGVKWYVVDKGIPLSANSSFKLTYSDRQRNVLLDPLAKPLVYWQGDLDGASKIHYKFTSNSIEIDCNSKTGGIIVINVLRHQFFSAQMDGKPLLITETGEGQVSLSVPKGQHRILLKYTDKNFIYSSFLSVIFILLLITFLILPNGVKDKCIVRLNL